MASQYEPGNHDSYRQTGQRGLAAAPHDGFSQYQYQATPDRAHLNYPPPHNQSNPSFYKIPSPNPSMNKNDDVTVTVSDRYTTRTPSPSPSEAALLNRKGFIDWQKMKNWRFWIRREWLWYYVIFIIIFIIVVLISVYDRQIVTWLKPTALKIRDLPAGWLIPIAILFVLSFPPLFGHEIIAILAGVVWGLWPGFGITAAGTFVGELGNFYAFKYCCRARGEKLERTELQYACLAKIVREGGFKIALIARYSAIPGHFTTAVFSTCGMGVLTFACAAILSLPKQFVTVYIGVVLEESGTGTESTKDKIISYSVIAITSVITWLAMRYIYNNMDKVKVDVVYSRRKARQAKLDRATSGGSSVTAFNPRESDSDLPLNPGESDLHQRWDTRGNAIGHAGDPRHSLSTSVHAPTPQRTGTAADVARIPTYRTEGGGGYSTTGTRYAASPVAGPSSHSTSPLPVRGSAPQRQESADTVAWDMGPDSYRLPSIDPGTPLSGGFANAPLPANNPYAQQQQRQYRQTSLNNPFSNLGNLPGSSASPVPPPLAPPPSSSQRQYGAPSTMPAYQHQQPSSPQSAGPSSTQFPPSFQFQSTPATAPAHVAPLLFQQQQQQPASANAYTFSSPSSVPHSPARSPLATPTQYAFAYQPPAGPPMSAVAQLPQYGAGPQGQTPLGGSHVQGTTVDLEQRLPTPAPTLPPPNYQP